MDDRDDAPASDVDDSVIIAGRYQLLARIGRGATGSVYRAHDQTLDREVAIKLLEPGQLALAEREAQILAKVNHRNVVTIHDLGHDGGLRYLVLELLDGKDFRAWLRERPPSDEILRRFIAAGRGLAAAHQSGLLHRDFKPSNVLLTEQDRVVVIDFGLARGLDGHSCGQAGELAGGQMFTEGTLAYMAPERLAGQDDDERSDQFSFCVALWEALAGTSPFVGADPLARYRSIREGPARAMSRATLDAPRHVVAALRRGLAFEPERRFSTMHELVRELARGVGRPRTAGSRTAFRSALTAAAMAATFALGWGLMPETTAPVAFSSLDPRADAALVMLESAHKRAADGDHRTALSDLLNAAELIDASTTTGDAEYCTFGRELPRVADVMDQGGGQNEARMAYAIATHFARGCDGMSKDALQARREAARAAFWLESEG